MARRKRNREVVKICANGEEQENAGPEAPPPFERRIILGGRQAAGLALMFAVPALALAQLLGDRVERHELKKGDWVLAAEVPVCARDGDPLTITVSLSRAGDRSNAAIKRVEVSTDYMERFTDVRRRPAVFAINSGADDEDAGAPVAIELTPDRFGWARGRLDVTTETGERMELPLKTFVFP